MAGKPLSNHIEEYIILEQKRPSLETLRVLKRKTSMGWMLEDKKVESFNKLQYNCIGIYIHGGFM